MPKRTTTKPDPVERLAAHLDQLAEQPGTLWVCNIDHLLQRASNRLRKQRDEIAKLKQQLEGKTNARKTTTDRGTKPAKAAATGRGRRPGRRSAARRGR